MPALRRTLALAGCGLAASWSAAAAGSSVVRLDGAAAAGTAVGLGRGYSAAGHSFVGNCFATVAASRPSYDFRYIFEAVTGDDPDRNHIRVVLDFQVYNRSLDEAASTLAPPALGLIARGDLLGFFDACGVSYVRSITRSGRYESILSYAGETPGRDVGFERELESWIKGWGHDGPTPAPGGRDFARRAARSQLAVRSTGSGFGKRAGASLVADDLESFRAAAQAAFQSMQADDVGHIEQIEVAPWSEQPWVREALHLPRAGGHRLLENSELLSELGRVQAARRELAQRAALCRRTIERDYLERDDAGSIIGWRRRGDGDWSSARSQNHHTLAWDRTLAEVWLVVGAITDDDGTASPADPEAACIRALLIGDTLSTGSYRELDACRDLERAVVEPPDPVIAHYCIPSVEDAT